MSFLDFEDLRGNHRARRAVEIAAAGEHGILLCGSRGSDYAPLARRIETILPKLTEEEILALADVYSRMRMPMWIKRPFRAPHHSVSGAGLLGGGNPPRPGEISLAHGGVLLIDEIDEFPSNTLRGLSHALEQGNVAIVRPGQVTTFPARALMVARMEPCAGRCTPARCARRIARAWLGMRRVDIVTEMMTPEALTGPKEECSADILRRVVLARQMQAKRHEQKQASAALNSLVAAAEIARTMDSNALPPFHNACEQLSFDAIEREKALRIARTIADLDQSEALRTVHAAEAVSLVLHRGCSALICKAR